MLTAYKCNPNRSLIHSGHGTPFGLIFWYFVVLFLLYQELHLMYVSLWHYPRQISLSKSNHDFQRHLFFTLCIKPIFTERWREYANATRFTDLYKTEQMGFEVLQWQNKTNKESLKWVAKSREFPNCIWITFLI